MYHVIKCIPATISNLMFIIRKGYFYNTTRLNNLNAMILQSCHHLKIIMLRRYKINITNE